jgi:hypothetical protein
MSFVSKSNTSSVSESSPIMSAPEIITLSKRKARKLDGWGYYIYKINRLAQKSLGFTLISKNNNSLVYEWADEVSVTRFLFTFRFKGDASRRECKFGYMSFKPESYSKFPVQGLYDVLELDDTKLNELFALSKNPSQVEGLDVVVIKKKTPRSIYKEFKTFLEDIYYDYNIDMYGCTSTDMECEEGNEFDEEDDWYEEDYDY